MKKLDFFWKTNKNWYRLTNDLNFVLNDDAPPEAQESYKHYLEQTKEMYKNDKA